MARRLFLTALFFLSVMVPATVATMATVQAYNPLQAACKADTGGGNASDTAACDNGGSTPILGTNNVFIRTARIIALIGGAAAVILIIVSGIQIITANGDANSVANGRRTIIYAVVGIIVIALAQAIISVVIGRLS